eukprot:Skav204462  [mRNA]  locus=scaffold3437:19911:20438:+ [translate_table: standard]
MPATLVIGMQVLGVNFEIATASDTDAVAREFISTNFQGHLGKLHHNMESQTMAPEEDIEIFVAGIPCKPYSMQRAKRFEHGNVKSHASHATLFDEFCPWLDAHDPVLGIFENVDGLDVKYDASTKETPLEMPFVYNGFV